MYHRNDEYLFGSDPVNKAVAINKSLAKFWFTYFGDYRTHVRKRSETLRGS